MTLTLAVPSKGRLEELIVGCVFQCGDHSFCCEAMTQ